MKPRIGETRISPLGMIATFTESGWWAEPCGRRWSQAVNSIIMEWPLTKQNIFNSLYQKLL